MKRCTFLSSYKTAKNEITLMKITKKVTIQELKKGNEICYNGIRLYTEGVLQESTLFCKIALLQ